MSNDPLLALNAKLDALLDLLRASMKSEEQPMLPVAEAYVWLADTKRFEPVEEINRVDLNLLVGIDHVRDQLVRNTMQFASGHPANNVLLWGARGMGKSSLVKAAHKKINDDRKAEGHTRDLKLVEIHREDIDDLPLIMRHLKAASGRFILFCDDLSFDGDDASYKSLKTALDGGVEGRPENVIFYATSNRRHLIPRQMMENERSTAINPSEATEEKVSLSDRFGLWLGFHKCDQKAYLAMVEGYVDALNVQIDTAELHKDALEWAKTRGNRSGRVAWQFTQDLAGRLGC